ncbi:hypothetical protein [Mesonia sp. K7]|uniref:hypothetical protein n=1 Tax=Mesonia sp. K7 TaxID=2218606 RepID=UPI000DA7E54E|nr:hypothetical protein [Mesonia sp. K7]PZD77777.1 hypothetical protein DNG35_08035 [Mesonia sp. K7]
MKKLYKYFEYAYLFIAALFTYEAITSWSTDRSHAYLCFAFVAVAIFMFFFKRNFRRKMEERNKDQ